MIFFKGELLPTVQPTIIFYYSNSIPPRFCQVSVSGGLEKLYQLCKTFGARTLLWRQKFIGLLPEVNRRKLYEKKGL